MKQRRRFSFVALFTLFLSCTVQRLYTSLGEKVGRNAKLQLSHLPFSNPIQFSSTTSNRQNNTSIFCLPTRLSSTDPSTLFIPFDTPLEPFLQLQTLTTRVPGASVEWRDNLGVYLLLFWATFIPLASSSTSTLVFGMDLSLRC